MSLLLTSALLFTPQIQMTPQNGSLNRPVASNPFVPGNYPTYTNGGRVTQLGLLHAEGLETYGLFRPGQVPTSLSPDRPLLVLFHSFGGDGDLELESWTEFSNQADARHWYILAPDQDVPHLGLVFGSTARRKTYGNDDAQERLALTLRWVLDNYPIDRDRIFGVGYSMGGGDVLSYAAQHLDRAHGAFAALATNAGTLCLTEEYWRNPASQAALERAVGGGLGPNAINRFDFERMSTLLYVDPFGQTSPSMLDLLRRHPIQNLVSTPLQAWIDTREPSEHLTEFVEDLDVLLGAPQPGGLYERHDVTGTNKSAHRWDTFDFAAVCDSFATKELVVPETAHLTVARDARYWDLTIQRNEPNAFGEVRYDFTQVGVTGVIDHVRIVDCRNIQRVRLDGGVLGLGMTGERYHVSLQGNPDRPVRLELQNVPPPARVVRDGLNVTQLPPTQGRWAYDSATQTLTLLSSNLVTELWEIR